MFDSVDNNPDVIPTPVRKASGFWSSIGSAIGLLIDVLPVVGPVVPDSWKPYLPVVGAVAGLILHRYYRDSYIPK